MINGWPSMTHECVVGQRSWKDLFNYTYVQFKLEGLRISIYRPSPILAYQWSAIVRVLFVTDNSDSHDLLNPGHPWSVLLLSCTGFNTSLQNDLDFFIGIDIDDFVVVSTCSQGIGNEDGFVLSGVSRLNILKKKLSAQWTMNKGFPYNSILTHL